MKEEKVFFYLKDINLLVEEAIKAGGVDLGIVVTSNGAGRVKPELRVSYLKPAAAQMSSDAVGDILTKAIDGCPFPPRCS